MHFRFLWPGFTLGSFKKEKLPRDVALEKTIDMLHKCLVRMSSPDRDYHSVDLN